MKSSRNLKKLISEWQELIFEVDVLLNFFEVHKTKCNIDKIREAFYQITIKIDGIEEKITDLLVSQETPVL